MTMETLSVIVYTSSIIYLYLYIYDAQPYYSYIYDILKSYMKLYIISNNIYILRHDYNIQYV